MRFGVARHGWAWPGADRAARHGRPGEARQGLARRGEARRGMAGKARPGVAWPSLARPGEAWRLFTMNINQHDTGGPNVQKSRNHHLGSETRLPVV